MKLLKIDSTEKRIEAVPEILDDLWHLENTIEPGDELSGATERKIKISGTDKTDKIKMFLTIQVKDAQFHRDAKELRINGIILSGKPEELVELKSHHTLEIKLNQKVSIQKANWKEYQVRRLKDAQKATFQDALLACILDDENATIAWIKAFTTETALTLNNPKTGKRFNQTDSTTEKYYETILEKIKELKPKKLVIAGPGFAKEDLKKIISQKKLRLAEQTLFETVNSTGETGLNELLKSGQLEKQVQENQLASDAKLLEFFLGELGRDTGLCEYGFDPIRDAANTNAIAELLITDQELAKNNENIFALIRDVEHAKGRVHIFSHQTPPGKQLQGFGGIAAILKFKTKWE